VGNDRAAAGDAEGADGVAADQSSFRDGGHSHGECDDDGQKTAQ
jgi:hypothetical protein